MTQESLTGKVVNASKWLAFARIIFASLTFISITVLARILTPEDYGLVAIASVVTVLIQSVAQIPVGQALIRLKKLERSHFDTAFTVSCIRTTFLASVICVAAHPTSVFYSKPQVELVLYVMAASTFISGLTNPKFILFEKNLDFKKHFVTSSMSTLVVFCLSIAIAVLYESYWALVLGSIAGQLINVIITYALLPYVPRLSLKKFREVFNFAVWLSLGNLLNQLQWNFDQLVIGKFLGVSKLGIYNMGVRIASLPSHEIIVPLLRTLYPAFSSLADDKKRLTDAFLLTQSTLIAVALPLGIGVALYAEAIIMLLVGEQWLDSVIVVQLLAAIQAFQSTTAGARALAMSQGKTRWIFSRDLLMVIVHVPAMYLGYQANGIVGMLVARLLTGLLLIAMNLFMVKKVLSVSILRQLIHANRTFVSVALMILINVLLPDPNTSELAVIPGVLELLTLVSICGLAYIFSHFFLWFLADKPSGLESKLIEALVKVHPKLRLVIDKLCLSP